MRQQLGKDKIMRAALRLFGSQGYHKTSISQIAAAAGVSKGLAYNYFDSKQDLLLAIINEASQKMFEVAGSMSGEGGYQAGLYRVLDDNIRFIKRSRDYLTFQLSLLFQPDLKAIVSKPLRARAERLLVLSQAMFARAGVDNPELTARRFISEIDGIALHYLSVFEDFPIDQMFAQLFNNYKELGK